MLLELYIKDYALVEEAVLKFGPGLNVLTGETGTGKSIIIGAVTLLLGGRGIVEHIRTGCDEASVHGVFAVAEDAPLRMSLADFGIDLGEDDTVVISCLVSRLGRSQRRVNGRPITQAMLMDIGEYLVDIHGQHDHQALLRQQRHIEYLDNFAGEEGANLRRQVKTYYEQLNEHVTRLKELRLSERERAQRLDLLQFQAQEIDAVRLMPNEDTSLAKEHNVLASAGELHERSSLAYSLIHGEDHGAPGIIDGLAGVLKELEPILEIDDTLRDTMELLKTALAACEESSRQIRLYRDRIDQDPERLAQIEARLSAIQRLKRKYRDTVDEILDYRQIIGEEISQLESSSRGIDTLEEQIAKTRLELGRVSERLHKVRMEAAEVLEKHVTHELRELAMESSVFRVDFSNKEDPQGIPIGDKMLAAKANGIDSVEFLLSANPGEPPKPLAKIASGGEISRVMLALKSILASVDEVSTLIFDEIDVGIGGRVATVIGEKLAAIGRMRQVICVTHLPQIACMADTHYSITKEIEGGRARTVVTQLQEIERVREIARMLGGDPGLDTASMKHAKEMLRTAQ